VTARALAAVLLAGSLIAAPPAAAQSRQASGSILHTALLGTYGFWMGQDSALEGQGAGYGATVRYLGGSPGGTRLGVGINWVRNTLAVKDRYRADGRTFTDDLTTRRTGVDLYYGLPANERGNVPYFLAGGGRMVTAGDTAANGNIATGENFWEAGMGIINGGSQYTAFALELKYIRAMEQKIRADDGIIQLSMSVGYNW